MAFYLARPEDQVRKAWMKRFDAAHWRLNFPRPMMASAITTVPGSLRVDCAFLKRNDLAGLIWTSVDDYDHPLLTYETSRDYRGVVLSFGWRVEGSLRRLDVPNGAVLTIEGRDQDGTARVWYVRLWNYAEGTPTDAQITLDFDALESGYALPGEPVYAGDIDRMFISLVPDGYDGADAPLGAPESATVHIDDIRCEGGGATIGVGDAAIPPHRLHMATGYDDEYDVTPERLLRNVEALGYRDR
ncbi:MAG: TIGR02217 family protein, partial [Pseudomonadota bacterium]